MTGSYEDRFFITKQYLLGQYEWEGVTYGIPREYWLHQMEFHIYYGFFPYDNGAVFAKDSGKVSLVKTMKPFGYWKDLRIAGKRLSAVIS